MTKEERAQFGAELREKLSSHRDVFAIDKYMFEKTREGDFRFIGQAFRKDLSIKRVSAAALKLLLDYCEHSEWEMPFVDYCAAIFHGRAPQEGETAFDLLPDVQDRMNLERLGFGHIYGGHSE